MAYEQLGRVQPLHRGDYSATTGYELNDIVMYTGSVYWHKTDEITTGVAPTNTTVWAKIIDMSAAEEYIGQAETAAETAGNYKDTALNAKNDAIDAQTAAEAAQDAAETAQTAAEIAQENAEDSAEDSEAYAVGTRSGTAVESTDPAYHNNSKYYSEQAQEAAEGMENKADIDGYYSTLTAGRAENLVDTRATGIPRSFTFGTTAGVESVEDLGTAEIKSIHGKTLVWNQLYSASRLVPEYTTMNVQDGVVTVTSNTDTTAIKRCVIRTPISGHKYYLAADIANVDTDAGSSSGCAIAAQKSNGSSEGFFPVGGYTGTSWMKASGVVMVNEAVRIAIRLPNTAASGTSAKFRNIIVCDLTQMFGAGNEPTTAADFEAMFLRADYAYNAGSLLNFTGTGIKTVGFNLLDVSTGKARIPTGNAQITGTFTALTAPDGTSVTPDEGGYFTSVGGEYTVAGADGTTCVHLVWSGYRNGEYEDYWTRTLDLPIATYFPDGMRSTPGYFDELTADKAVKRITEIDLGSLTWTKNGDRTQYSAPVPSGTPTFVSDTSGGTTIRCAAYPSGNAYTVTTNKSISSGATRIWIADPNISTAADLKTALTGVKAYVALAEPVVTAIAVPLNLVYQVDDFGTEELFPANDDEPETAPFSGVIAYSTDFTRQVSNMPKNYTSQNTLDELLSALGTATGKTFTKTWDAANNKWTFTVTEA